MGKTDAPPSTVVIEASMPVAVDAGAQLPASRLRRITAYIEENLQGKLRLTELGAVVHMSPYHFARLFRQSTGTPPHRFVRDRRIAHARLLLVTGDLSIGEIARAVGFLTASHFSTVFRRATGVAPIAYRAARPRESPPR